VEFFSLALREARVARERDALRVEVQLLRASTLVAVPLSEVDGLRGLPSAGAVREQRAVEGRWSNHVTIVDARWNAAMWRAS
jgi:hypothetical protein